MPARSQAQQAVFGMALAARRGELKPDELQGAARKLYRDTSLSDEMLAEYADSKRSELPSRLGQMSHRNIRARRG